VAAFRFTQPGASILPLPVPFGTPPCPKGFKRESPYDTLSSPSIGAEDVVC